MNISTLHIIFNICLGVGFVLPILSILTGWFGDFFNVDVDVDFDVDVSADAGMDGPEFGGVIPFNMMCFCLLLIVFGAFGKACARWMTSLGVTAAFLLGILAVAGFFYWLLYTLVIKKLKSSDSQALSYDDFAGRRGEVTLPVRAGRIGMISVMDSTGSYISFRAKIDPGLQDFIGDVIPRGETVLITEVNAREKFCCVSPLLDDVAARRN
ncbi:MAG: NfeD family protein [Peptococcaceae bacterium]|jgi:membrane protein implicated in regulation of membrane protease activity|nr:NfeD family protein [Peptococcaceae bacterium]